MKKGLRELNGDGDVADNIIGKKRGPPRRSSRSKVNKLSKTISVGKNIVASQEMGRSGKLIRTGSSSNDLSNTDETSNLYSPPGLTIEMGPDRRPDSQHIHGDGGSAFIASNSSIEVNGNQDALITRSSPDRTPSGLSSEDVPQPDLDQTPTRPRLSRRRFATRGGDIAVLSMENTTSSGDRRLPSAPPSARDQELHSSFNRVKLDLLEALRDKKAYSSALVAVKEQKDNLEKEVAVLRQQNGALEIAMNSTKRSKSGKKHVWSMANLQDTKIASYQGICLAAGEVAKKEGMLLTTETFLEDGEDGLRKRNWTGSATVVSMDVAKEAILYVILPDGSFAIPTSCMKRAITRQQYLSPYGNEKGFAQYCIRKILSSAVGSMMNTSEEAECESLILTHRQTLQKFKAVLSDSVGTRKKATMGVFLRSLGYMNGAKPNSDKLTLIQKVVRNTEREIVYDKCVKVDGNGKADTMHWRLSTWSSLCIDTNSSNIDAHEMDEAEKAMEDEGKVDNFFLNEPARRAFNELRGYQVADKIHGNSADVSFLSIARADAAMTTMLQWIKIGGRGGVRNSNYSDCFRELLPVAMNAIIKEVWDDLKALVPHEMVPYMQSQEGSDNGYGNEARKWTCVIKSPEDSYLYLLAKPDYFLQKVCSWLGCVKDCQVGRCLPTDSGFTRIDSTTPSIELEESDLDEDMDDNGIASNVPQSRAEDRSTQA